MPILTKVYKLDVFGSNGDQYYSALDKRRSTIIENQLLGHLNLFGGGVISGLEISKEIGDFDFSISEGLAIVPFQYITIEYVNGLLPLPSLHLQKVWFYHFHHEAIK